MSVLQCQSCNTQRSANELERMFFEQSGLYVCEFCIADELASKASKETEK